MWARSRGCTAAGVPQSPSGIRVSDLLRYLASDPGELPDGALFELTGGLLRALAAFHRAPGAPRHGAIMAAHVFLAHDGGVSFTGTDLAGRIEPLQRNREQLWREFGLAFPPAASLPRFDRRADVTQLAAVALALTLRRPLELDEYPRDVPGLVIAATSADSGDPRLRSALRMWLMQALQLHSRANFSSADDAERAFAGIPVPPPARRAGLRALRALIARLTPRDQVA